MLDLIPSSPTLSRRIRTIHDIPVIDSFPSPLYRAFDKEEYARSFVEQGVFQLRPIPYYCKIEDTNRKDKGEGEGRVIVNMNRPVLTLDNKSLETLSETNEFGPVNFGTSSINPRYILCFSGPQVERKHLTAKYGPYVVSISEPQMLVNDIAVFLEHYQNTFRVMHMDCVQVRYDKGQLVSELPEPASYERTRMSYAQKVPSDSIDCEYRLVLELPINGGRPSETRVELHKKLDYAEMLWA